MLIGTAFDSLYLPGNGEDMNPHFRWEHQQDKCQFCLHQQDGSQNKGTYNLTWGLNQDGGLVHLTLTKLCLYQRWGKTKMYRKISTLSSQSWNSYMLYERPVPNPYTI